MIALGATVPAQATFPGKNGKILFFRGDANYANAHPHLINPDGTGLTDLGPGGDISTRAQWSPDGTRYIYSEYTAAGWRFLIKNADGSEVTRLGSPQYDIGSPSWSPDGQQIRHNYGMGTNVSPRGGDRIAARRRKASLG